MLSKTLISKFFYANPLGLFYSGVDISIIGMDIKGVHCGHLSIIL